MKLRHSPTSPYVRKVMMTAIETGLDGRIKIIPTNVWDPATDVADDNPLGKVPALLLDGGEALYDSVVICEYLDSLHDGARLIPAAGGARWTVLRRQALADGILDAAILRFLEARRPENERSKSWDERQKAVVVRGLDALEEEADGFGGDITIGHIAIAATLGWLDFRFDNDNWRDGRPALADFYDGFSGRACMTTTVPKDPS